MFRYFTKNPQLLHFHALIYNNLPHVIEPVSKISK